MDSENEFSALESVEDSEAISPKMILNNGSYANNSDVSVENIYDREILQEDTKEENDVNDKLRSPTLSATPDEGSPSNRKGLGLKKWKRFRRDHVKDANPFADSSKMLKRGLAVSINQSKPQFSSPDSIGSENTHSNVGIIQSLTVPISISDSRFAVGSAISAGGDSDSEERGSKSSTAASAPKTRQPRPVREKSRIMNPAARNLGSSALNSLQGKGRSEGSKKLRGEKVKLEEENSLSSLESDSVNSNFIFAHSPFTANNNGKQGGRPANYGGENGDGAHQFEQQYVEEAERENVEVVEGEVEELLENDDAEEYLENHQEERDQDFLADSILSLQSVQEALEREVQKLGTIGREAIPSDSSINDNSESFDFLSTLPEASVLISSDLLDSETLRQKSSLEAQLLLMAENVKALERKLEASTSLLEAKELHMRELLVGINHSKLPEEESGIYRNLDGVFRLKIEAEIEYLVLSRTMQTMKDAINGQTELFEEQKALVEEQLEMIHKLGETESKVIMLKKQAKQLEKYCDEISGTEDVLKMQRKVCKVTCCFFTELVLLILVLWVFVLKSFPEPQVLVPT